MTGSWPLEFFNYQHWLALCLSIKCDLYEGEPVRALERLEASQSQIASSYLFRISDSRIEVHSLSAAVELAVAGEGRVKLQRSALKRAKRLQRERTGDALGTAALIRATVACQRGRNEDALAELGKPDQTAERGRWKRA